MNGGAKAFVTCRLPPCPVPRSRQSLIQWVTNGGDQVAEAMPDAQLMLDQLTGML
jgi:hypothetical protein